MNKPPPPELRPFLDALAEMVADQIIVDGITPEQIRAAAANHCRESRTPGGKLHDAVQHAKQSKAPDE